MLKIRRPLGRLIFNMGIAIPGKTVFLIETAPWWLELKYKKSESEMSRLIKTLRYSSKITLWTANNHKSTSCNQGPLVLTRVFGMRTWVSNYIHCFVWGAITYPCHNFNSCLVEVSAIEARAWMIYHNLHITMDVITYPCHNLELTTYVWKKKGLYSWIPVLNRV